MCEEKNVSIFIYSQSFRQFLYVRFGYFLLGVDIHKLARSIQSMQNTFFFFPNLRPYLSVSLIVNPRVILKGFVI